MHKKAQESVVYLRQKLLPKRKKIKKMAKVPANAFVCQCKCHSSHWVSVLLRCYDTDFEHAEYTKANLMSSFI